MKKLQRLCAATILLFVLSLSAVAGDITTNVVSPPPPPPASTYATEPGNIGTGETQNLIVQKELLTEITLSLLQLLSVF